MRYNQLRGRIPILVFHRISNDIHSTSQPLSVKTFESIILFLKQHYEIRPLDDLFNKEANLKRSCFITFDDATEDFYENALPILIEQAAPFSQYIPTEAVTKNEPIWTNRLFGFWDSLETTVKLEIEENVFTLQPSPKPMDVHKVIECLRKYSPQDRDKKIMELESTRDAYRPINHMSWAQLTECKQYGNLGSHSLSHPDLRISDSVESEIESSKASLSEKGFNVTSFAYPFGSYDKSIEKVTANHYEWAFCTEDALLPLRRRHKELKYKLPRITMIEEDKFLFVFRAIGFIGFFRKFLHV